MFIGISGSYYTCSCVAVMICRYIHMYHGLFNALCWPTLYKNDDIRMMFIASYIMQDP